MTNNDNFEWEVLVTFDPTQSKQVIFVLDGIAKTLTEQMGYSFNISTKAFKVYFEVQPDLPDPTFYFVQGYLACSITQLASMNVKLELVDFNTRKR